MNVEIGDHALIDKFPRQEIAGQFDALALRHFTRKGELHLAAKLGVLTFLERLDIVPELFTVAPFLRRVLRQHDLGMDDAALSGKVLIAAQPVVAQPRGRTVGGGCNRAAARRASDDLNGEMVDRHGDRPDTALKRTSERRISAPSKLISRDDPHRSRPSRQHRSISVGTKLSPLDRLLMEDMMRKPRDFDAELKVLEDKARDLKARKVQQLGELVISTGADALTADGLAGALIVLAETRDAGKRGGVGQARGRVLSKPGAAICISA